MKPALAAIVILVIGVTAYALVTRPNAAPMAANTGADGMNGPGGMSDSMSGSDTMANDGMGGGKMSTMEPSMQDKPGMKDTKGMKPTMGMAGDKMGNGKAMADKPGMTADMKPKMKDTMKADEMLPETSDTPATEPEMTPEK